MQQKIKNGLTIYIVTRDRHLQVQEAIRSVLHQNCPDYQIIISDNSTSDGLGAIVMGISNAVKYIRRSGYLTALEHFNACISEADTKYFALFHDDDVMLPNFVELFWRAHSHFPDAIAYGANAIIQADGLPCGLAFKASTEYVGPIDMIALGSRYFARHQMGIAPLPSYVYQKTDDLIFDLNAGKYGDVQWLLMHAELGDIVWINEPSMIYRLHDTNDSKAESFSDRLKFLRFLKTHKIFSESIILIHYRRFLYKKILLDGNLFQKIGRNKILRDYLIRSQWNINFIIHNFTALIKKISNRIQALLDFY